MTFVRALMLVGAVVTAIQLTGCAAPATSQAMTVQSGAVATASSALKGTVKVSEISGGKETNPMWTSQVDGPEFKKALSDSLNIAGYLAADPSAAKYDVKAKLLGLDQPMFGLTFDVKSSVEYQVSGAGVAKTIPISATGTATTSDAFAGVARLRIANERSILENIKAILTELGKVVAPAMASSAPAAK